MVMSIRGAALTRYYFSLSIFSFIPNSWKIFAWESFQMRTISPGDVEVQS